MYFWYQRFLFSKDTLVFNILDIFKYKIQFFFENKLIKHSGIKINLIIKLKKETDTGPNIIQKYHLVNEN